MICRPRCNRVSPFGEIEATPHRGTLMGNRGGLHGENGTVIRRWRSKRWISCVLDYPGSEPLVFDKPGFYTPLFFLDEAVALSAGHRPCAHCRPAAYRLFRTAWQFVRGRRGQFICAADIDAELHHSRTSLFKNAILEDITTLPPGTFVALPDDFSRAWLWTGVAIREWSHAGYGEPKTLMSPLVRALTPRTVIEVLRAGYRPTTQVALIWHHKDATREPSAVTSDTGRTQLALL